MNVNPPNNAGSRKNGNHSQNRGSSSAPMAPNAAGDRAHGNFGGRSGPAVSRPAQMQPGTGNKGNAHRTAKAAQPTEPTGGSNAINNAGQVAGSMRTAK
jgi:hypothetical protein